MKELEQMDKTIEELKEEADALGIKYSANIGAAKLQEKIDEYDAKLDAEVNGVVEPVKVAASTDGKKMTEFEARLAIKALEDENRKTKVVKIAMVDKRESAYATSAYFSTGDIAMRVPLDVWVEMPVILILMAEDAQALVHVESGGTTTSKFQKKYVVEYK